MKMELAREDARTAGAVDEQKAVKRTFLPRRAAHGEWVAEGIKLFGKDTDTWRFVCPSCGHVAAVRDWREAEAPEGAVAFSCVGRWIGAAKQIFESPGPCNYAGGGLFGLNPVTVVTTDSKERAVFEFDHAAAEAK